MHIVYDEVLGLCNIFYSLVHYYSVYFNASYIFKMFSELKKSIAFNIVETNVIFRWEIS